MKRLAQLTSLVVTLGALGAACSGSIVTDGDEDGEGGSGGEGGAPQVTTTTAITTGTNPPPPSPAISMLRYELDNPPSSTSVAVSVSSVSSGGNMNTTAVTTGGNPTTGSVTTGSGPTTGSTTGSYSSSVSSSSGGLDPNDLVIILGNQLQACEDPFASDCSTQSWKVYINLPVSMQQIGTYSLEGIANWSESDACNGGGGGSFWQGTIQVTSIDAGQVDFVLAGTNDFFVVEGNADGAWTAPRCF